MEDHTGQAEGVASRNLPEDTKEYKEYINGRPAEAELLKAGPYILSEATPEGFFFWLQDVTKRCNNAVLGKDSSLAFWAYESQLGPPSSQPVVRKFFEVSLGERDGELDHAMAPNIHFTTLSLDGKQIEVTGSCSFPRSPFADFFRYIVAELGRKHVSVMRERVEAEAIALPETLSKRTGGRPRGSGTVVEEHRNAVVALAGEGLSDSAIANKMGCSRTYITRLRKRWGIPANFHRGGKLVHTKTE